MDLSEINRFEKLHGFSAPRKMKLSEAIRAGIPHVKMRDRLQFQYCALGAAFYSVTGRRFSYDDPLVENGAPIESIARIGGWDERLCERISSLHADGNANRVECAKFAEARGA